MLGQLTKGWRSKKAGSIHVLHGLDRQEAEGHVQSWREDAKVLSLEVAPERRPPLHRWPPTIAVQERSGENRINNQDKIITFLIKASLIKLMFFA